MTPRELFASTRSPLAWLVMVPMLAWRAVPKVSDRCRFYPSCSSYGLEAVARHGALRGLVLAAWRLLRCNPWNPGGVDHVPHDVGWVPLRRRHTAAPDPGRLSAHDVEDALHV